MAISKPSWLRNALDHLNWDILTWKVYVGDAVESAIDWAIEKINIAIDWGEAAWNKAVVAWDKAVDVGKQAWKDLCREADKIWNNIETWWDDLGDWWQAKVTWIKGVVGVAEDTWRRLLEGVEIGLNWLDVQWDNFKKDTLPALLDFTWWTDFWGHKWTSFIEWEGFWWNKTTEEIEVEVKPVRDEVNKLSGLIDLIRGFINDPIDWIWGKLVDYLERHW